jgi:acyl-CoA synthetase (AMP-forming)/AMP-acid ligase II/acyl carrier protein
MIPLLRGAAVVCLPESDIEGFFAALDDYQITWFTAVFSVHREILRRAPDFREAVARNRLRCMRVSSGHLGPDEIDHIERTFGAPLVMGFGMTEATPITHQPLPPQSRKRGSVGLPVTNEVAVMSEAGAICATGEMGEVVVRGQLVFDGYFDDAQATAAAFVDDWFRTGDLGRLDEDGYLYLVGRIKDLINRGGEKISPVEIDAALEAIPGVGEAATFAIPHRSLGEEVAAAVVRDANVALGASDIIDQVRQRMGSKRVPRKIYFVDQLPRTESGKLRRSELSKLLGLDQPNVNLTGASRAEKPCVMGSPLQAGLARLWASVLRVRRVGPDDDFFILGGDSLSGARLLVGVKSVFGVNLSLQLLFQDAATVSGMARAIEVARSGNGTVDREPRG